MTPQEQVNTAVERFQLKRALYNLMLEYEEGLAHRGGFCIPENKCLACRALSPDAGKGWMSPEERREDDAVLNDAMSMAHRDREKHKARADAWREDAENLAQFIPVKNNPAGQAALAAHDALVAKEKETK